MSIKHLWVTGWAWLLIATSSQALTINLDFTHDGGFYDSNPDAKATLIRAADDLGAALSAAGVHSLAAVPSNIASGQTGTSVASLTWVAHLNEPNDLSQSFDIEDFSLPADTIRIYAGATATLDGDEVIGEGAPAGGYFTISYDGDTAEGVYSALLKAENVFNATLSRGGGPRLYTRTGTESIADEKDFNYTLGVGSLFGSLTFNTSTKWNFQYDRLPASDEYDFYTVMLHELMHALGFGSSASWEAHVSGANWDGTHVAALVGNGQGLIHEFYDPGTNSKPDGGHVADGVMSEVLGSSVAQTPVMASDLAAGMRRALTKLDLAFMQDLDTDPPLAVDVPIVSNPIPTSPPVVVAAPPTPPTVTGKIASRTTKSKITIKGVLVDVDSSTAYVVYKVGKGSFVRAKGKIAWKAVVKLKPGKNVILIATFDPNTGLTSKTKKITVTRVAAP